MEKSTVLEEEISLDIGDTFKIGCDGNNIIITIQTDRVKEITLPKSDNGYCYFVEEDEIEPDIFRLCLYYQAGDDAYAIIYSEGFVRGILYVWKYPNTSVEEVLSVIYSSTSDGVPYDVLLLEKAIKKM